MVETLFSNLPTPRSTCSKSCVPGYRKVALEGQPKCCYDCILCSEGQISNITDADNCFKCPEDHWPDKSRAMCIPRSIEFLSFDDPLGGGMAAVSLFFTMLTLAVLCIFRKHNDTPVVKANNQNLSYILLLSLALCFLSALLFIGRPLTITCQLRQAAFGIIFTIAVSCVLAKTFTVIIAFSATRPNSRLRNWVGTRVSSSIVILGTFGEVVICIVWLVWAPPFQDYDTQSMRDKIIIQCNEGSVMLFYLAIGYMGFLAMLSFMLAFMARKLPNTFNEAQYITFSMLLVCSVWILFIPVYLSTRGKYTVVVEIFTIVASSMGLLCCIFIPKCYIILLRSDLNTKKKLLNIKQ
ncbi:vomeronasal type-2 receptor 26-like [Pelobates fuscus]|uniref:vomeronasal type-2 receptor 26-like n=1 Tax=Pelobates fuscus TaxID=191477 RepID=UPI002FE4B55F